eukprot:CAMPEP_0203985264 /NCGR_PEP_ID=MMETSP0360-20130528/5237_1 /ASSEMBLY_ACC=CAM_ASM_000342 /TAXON_ID=268821 /ORGANISM="Scrippsiella Hangoei, Strain SHTV-5" /LENGTH=71 /DNA_ID=CAMNT_0050924529 /DNA_START=77 /DNA_END=289 /DNA_ORIENTATION=+
MTCMGFFAPGLITGSICWLALACVATFVQNMLFVKETPKITLAESRQLGQIVVWMSMTCMWLFWAFVYMHQ